MKRTIYLVTAETGEYLDLEQWTVCAYTSEADALAHVEKATEYANAWFALAKTPEITSLSGLEQINRMRQANPLDAKFNCQPTTGTAYDFREIDLFDRFQRNGVKEYASLRNTKSHVQDQHGPG